MSLPYLHCGLAIQARRYVSVIYCLSWVLDGLTLIQGYSRQGGNPDGAPRCSAPVTSPSPPRRRDLLSFLRFTLQPVDASQSVPLRSRRWNFSLFSGRTAPHAVDATPGKDEDVSHLSSAIFAASRIRLQTCGSNSPTEAEVTAAMHNVNGNAVHNSTQTSQSQGDRMSQDGVQAMTGCCGFVVRLVRPRPTSH